MEASKRLRESIQQLIAQSDSDLHSQRNATEFAMRKRIHETERAKDELFWQKKNVRVALQLNNNFVCSSCCCCICIFN